MVNSLSNNERNTNEKWQAFVTYEIRKHYIASCTRGWACGKTVPLLRCGAWEAKLVQLLLGDNLTLAIEISNVYICWLRLPRLNIYPSKTFTHTHKDTQIVPGLQLSTIITINLFILQIK